MKFLFYHDTLGGPYYQRKGLANVLASVGHQCTFWNEQTKSAFDMFSEYEPDIFMGQTYNLSRAIRKCLQARPNIKKVLYASAYGEILDNLDLNKYPIVAVTEEEKRNVEEVKPDIVWIHHHPNKAWVSIGHWKEFGCKPIGLCKAADVLEYAKGVYNDGLACDIGFIGGYWKYKSQELDKYILPLCRAELGLKVKLFGNQPWPVPNYLGFINEGEAKNLFKSAKVCPNVYEPHSLAFGLDVIERPFKVIAAGGLPVECGYVKSMHEDVFTETNLKVAESLEELIHWVKVEQEDRDIYIRAVQNELFNKHTYHHRVAQLFNELNLPEEANKVMQAYQEWREKNAI
jgi:hypothetical protein